METMPNTGIRPSAITAGQTSPYSEWRQGEGVPVYTGSYVTDLHAVPVEPWARVGQKGAFVCLGDQEFDDGWLMEIAPGGQTEVQHHMFEATIYVVEGRGATTIWQKGSDQKQTVEWRQGSLFSPPINCYYQHFNLDGQKPARLYAATTCPLMINILRNPEAVFNNDFQFADRFNPSDDFFAKTGQTRRPPPLAHEPGPGSSKLQARGLEGAGHRQLQHVLLDVVERDLRPRQRVSGRVVQESPPPHDRRPRHYPERRWLLAALVRKRRTEKSTGKRAVSSRPGTTSITSISTRAPRPPATSPSPSSASSSTT